MGRPQSATLDPDGAPSPIWNELRRLDARGRLAIPAETFTALGWSPGILLGVQEQLGRLRALQWTDGGEEVIARRRELLAGAADDKDAREALRRLDDRYLRLSVDAERRVAIPERVLGHLVVKGGDWIYVFIERRELEIWSLEERDRRARAPNDLIADLP